MATPTLLSVSNVALPNTADSGNVSVTAPTGANACVIGGTFYVGDNSVASSLTGSQLTTTTNGGLRTATPSGGNYMSSYAQAFQVLATGSQTIRLQKTGGYQEGPTCQIAWLTVDDPTDFVRSGGFLIDSQNSTPDTLSVTVNSATTDLVLGMFGTDGSSADPSAPTGTTQQGTLQTTQFDKSITFSVNSPGASTTTITAGSRDFPTLFGIALKAGGSGPVTAAQAESISFSDAQSGSAKFLGSSAESITFSDAQSSAAKFTGSTLESIAFTDAVTGVYRQIGDLSESLTFSDTQDGALVSGSISQETISFADSVDGQLDAVGAVGESLLFSDDVAGAFKGVDTLSESISFADSQTGDAKVVGDVAETISLAEVVDASARFSGLLSESLTFSDALTGAYAQYAAQDESITFTDSQIAASPGEATVVEQITLSDAQNATSVTSAQVVESITFVDFVAGPEVGDPVELLGGGPGLPRKKKRVVRTELDKDSFLYRLLSPEVREQIEPEVAEVIEAKAVEVVEQKAKPSPKAVRVALADEGIAYRQAYKEIYLELIGEIRRAQADEEEEEEAIAMALLL